MKACVAITSYCGRNVKKLFLKKKKRLRLEKITNGAVKIKSLNDQVLSTTGSVQPSSLWVQNSYPQN